MIVALISSSNVFMALLHRLILKRLDYLIFHLKLPDSHWRRIHDRSSKSWDCFAGYATVCEIEVISLASKCTEALESRQSYISGLRQGEAAIALYFSIQDWMIKGCPSAYFMNGWRCTSCFRKRSPARLYLPLRLIFDTNKPEQLWNWCGRRVTGIRRTEDCTNQVGWPFWQPLTRLPDLTVN